MFVILLTSVLLAACAPAAPAPSPAPATPSATALVSLTADVSQAAGTPTPTASPAAAHTPTPAQPAGAPVIVDQIKLGLTHDPWLYPRPLALDSGRGRIYVSGAPQRTLVILADKLTVDKSIEAGGNLALDAANERLFVGVPGGLQVYNTGSGNLMTEITLAQKDGPPASALPPAIPVASELSGDVYAIQYQGPGQSGLYRIRAAGLNSTPVMSEPRDVRAIAPDDAHNALYASINNGIPGSNNRNELWKIELRTGQPQFIVSGVNDVVVDGTRRQLIVALGEYFAEPAALQIWSGDPLTVTQKLLNIGGQLALDEQRDRLYVLSSGQPSQLMTLQASTLSPVADTALPDACTAMALDAGADRLYVLSGQGDLLVLSGQGQQAASAQAASTQAAPAQAAPAAQMSGRPVKKLVIGQTIFGLWERGAPQGSLLLQSQDGGAAWDGVGSDTPALSSVNDAALAQDGTIFAATQRGVYRSNDGGQSWQAASAGLSDVRVAQLAISPVFGRDRTLYARTQSSGGLYRSTDGGQTWVSLGKRYAALAQDPKTYALALSPDFEHDRTIFLSVERKGGGVLVSQDRGDSWMLMGGGTALALYPAPGFGRTHAMFGVFDQQGLLRSTDGGQIWSGALRGIGDASKQDALALSPGFERDRTALLLANSGQLYRTLDGGDSWQVGQTGSQLAAIATQTLSTITFDPADSMAVWLGTASGQVLRARVDDWDWQAAEMRGPAPTHLEAIALSPDFAQDGALFVASKESSVWLSTDKGESWREAGFPARELGIGRMHLAISPDYARDRTVFAATGSQLYRSADGGQRWQALPIGAGNMFPINALAVSPDYARDRTLMIAGDYRTPTVLRSSDGGDTWMMDAAGLPSGGGLNHLAFSPNFSADRGVYVWTESDGLYRSGDGGRNWGRVYKPQGSWLIQSFALSPDFARDRLMFLGTLKENHNVYRSADGGASWHPAELGLPLELLWASALALSPDFGHDRLIFLGTDQGVYRSTDGGQMWRPALGLPEVVALAIAPSTNGAHVIFAVSATDGLHISGDGGERWSPAY